MTDPALHPESGPGDAAPARLALVPPSLGVLEAAVPAVDRLIEAMTARAALGKPPVVFRPSQRDWGSLRPWAGGVPLAPALGALAGYVDPYLDASSDLDWLAREEMVAVLGLAVDERWTRGAVLYLVDDYLRHRYRSCPYPMDVTEFRRGTADVLRMIGSRSPWLRWLERRARQCRYPSAQYALQGQAAPAAVNRWLDGEDLPRATWHLDAVAEALDVDAEEVRIRTSHHVRPHLPPGWDHGRDARRAMACLAFWTEK